MKPQELAQHLDELLDSASFADYGPNGLQVEGTRAIKKIATAVSANLETIEQAIELDFDALVVHHGLFWKGDSFPITGVKRTKIEKLLANGISLFGYHLPLDAHQKLGNNWLAAKEMGWKHLQVFGEIGVQGVVSSIAAEEFVAHLEAFYKHEAQVSLVGEKRIERVALISGGAYRQLKEAAKAGVDCFITGNFDEPAYHMAKEEGVHFVALGHHATECVGPRALAGYMEKKLGCVSHFIEVDNPF